MHHEATPESRGTRLLPGVIEVMAYHPQVRILGSVVTAAITEDLLFGDTARALYNWELANAAPTGPGWVAYAAGSGAGDGRLRVEKVDASGVDHSRLWNELQVGALVGVQETASSAVESYDYDYDTPQNAAAPTSGQMVHANQETWQLRCNVASQTGAAGAHLRLMQGGTVSSADGSWTVTGVNDQGTWIGLAVTPETQLGGDGPRTFTFETAAQDNPNYFIGQVVNLGTETDLSFRVVDVVWLEGEGSAPGDGATVRLSAANVAHKPGDKVWCLSDGHTVLIIGGRL